MLLLQQTEQAKRRRREKIRSRENPSHLKEKKQSSQRERRKGSQLLTCEPSVARSVLLICAFTSSGRFIH